MRVYGINRLGGGVAAGEAKRAKAAAGESESCQSDVISINKHEQVASNTSKVVGPSPVASASQSSRGSRGGQEHRGGHLGTSFFASSSRGPRGGQEQAFSSRGNPDTPHTRRGNPDTHRLATMHEVREFPGHADIRMTEVYSSEKRRMRKWRRGAFTSTSALRDARASEVHRLSRFQCGSLAKRLEPDRNPAAQRTSNLGQCSHRGVRVGTTLDLGQRAALDP